MPFGGFGGFLHGCQLDFRVAKGDSNMMGCWLCSLVRDDGLKEYKGITSLFSQYSSPCGQFS
jgi:hypothetical protein